MVGISAWRKLIYSLIWQSVMWRPGKLRFLIGVKNPLPIDRPRPPENTAPCGAPPVARFATPVGLRPPFVAHPATLPHPDRRALLILFAAPHQVGFASQSRLDHSLKPQVEHVVQIHIAQQDADRSALRGSLFVRMDLSIF